MLLELVQQEMDSRFRRKVAGQSRNPCRASWTRTRWTRSRTARRARPSCGGSSSAGAGSTRTGPHHARGITMCCTGPENNTFTWFGECCSCCKSPLLCLSLPATFLQPRGTSSIFGASRKSLSRLERHSRIQIVNSILTPAPIACHCLIILICELRR